MDPDTLPRQGVTTIATTPRQALDGLVIGVGSRAECATCDHRLGEGSQAAVRAHRMSDEAEWTSAALYCAQCAAREGEIHTPTPGTVEMVVEGTLGVRAAAAAQVHGLCFCPDDGRDAVLDFSPADEGGNNAGTCGP